MLQVCAIVVVLVLTLNPRRSKVFFQTSALICLSSEYNSCKYVGTIKEYKSHMREFRVMH